MSSRFSTSSGRRGRAPLLTETGGISVEKSIGERSVLATVEVPLMDDIIDAASLMVLSGWVEYGKA
jgi:hypothetical protein